MEMMVNSIDLFTQALLEKDNFLIVAHEHPDPDSIGSMLAMYHLLQVHGKKCWMMCADPIPAYNWPNIDQILPLTEIPFENAVILDCEAERTGKVYELISHAKHTFNIDHHRGNNGNCDYNLIDPEQAATCMIIYRLYQALDTELSYESAQPLYGGLVGDTGGFRHSNTSVEVLSAAAEFVKYGANPSQTSREIFESKSLEFIKFLGYALGKIQTSYSNRLVWLGISLSDFEKFNLTPEDADQLIQYVRMIRGSEITILFREVAPNEIRIGFRSHKIDIHQLAVKFNGGGHLLAAGAKLEGSLEQVMDRVIKAAEDLLEGEFDGRNNQCN
ncbi:MAG: bifunctional oligoribonuclease/PAP phosphatase NrnA [Firmicutes bacterium]|nr:bifunctional oligoribonuclease/PAP phosphatase NrnA [Bacillota bacterium]